MPSDVLGAGSWTCDAENGYRRAGDLLDHFQYKPGWTFDLRRQAVGPNQIILTVTFRAPNSRNPEDTVPVVGTFCISPEGVFNREEKFFWQWLHHVVTFMETHEMNEWFRVRGELPYDPHREEAKQ